MEKKNFFKSLCMVFSLFALLFVSGCGQVELLSNMPEKEANEIMAIMQQHEIPISKKPGVELTWTIVLKNSSDFARAVKILDSKGHPNVQYNTIGDVFQKTGFVSSPLEERARFMYALSESIGETLNKIPGVLTSRVHIVLPENDSYADSSTEASASVFLIYKAGSNLDESVREIKYLVANSVQGLDYDRISIALFPVTFESDEVIDNVFDSNVSVLGLKMTSDAAIKFVIILVIFTVLLFCASGAAAFFFWEFRKLKKSNGADKFASKNAPVVVQQEKPLSDLDESEEENTTTEGK
ncbi:MAG: type III secretion inner membrane ring lipoprotein SctJ [Puniceicoccales bacterium]|nr:type III secretion inner membrane ring lipoprotein SctJ [Puniceicoccales bacterium]